jgi:predicted alpha-1,6-mannanase (GH76 family)
MPEISAAASPILGALQQWYEADPYARRTGLYSYADPSLDVDWGNWGSAATIGRNLVNGAIALSGQRNRIQDKGRWWNSANAITAVIGYMSATGDRSYLTTVVENTFKKSQGVRRPVNSRASPMRWLSGRGRACYPGFLNGYYDDEGWWALAWIAAYDLTGADRYLTAADAIFRDMTAGWDPVWGGGIYWGKYNGQPDRGGLVAVPRGWQGPYKNAIANELFIAVAAALGVRYRGRKAVGREQPDYEQLALRGWEWFSQPRPGGVAMINDANLVNDSPDEQGVNNNTKSIWSYNQGVILGGLADLTELTGEQAYLGRAQAIADSFIANPWYAVPRSGGRPARIPPPDASGVIDEILHEYNECAADGTGPPAAPPGVDSTQFKGIFMRHLARLYLTTSKPSYRQFILTNARSALSHLNDRRQFGCNWAAAVDAPDFIRQTAGLDLITAALLVAKAGTG